jgi:arylsulfatase A-like enzyme
MIERISNSPTIPGILQGKGYLSHQSGKWWEGSFRNGGFTHGMTRGFPEKDGRHGDDGLTIGRQGMKPVLNFISEAKTAEKPFFVWYAPFLPHTPHNPPERLLMKYQMAGRPVELAKYFAMVEWFDETCGELINYLDAEGLTENTLIVYCCDNGWVQATPESGLPETWKNGFAPRSKQSPYDGGVRTPIMFSWPGVIPPSDRSEPISTIDLMPTILAAANAEAPADLPGLNLFESIRDQKPIEREFLYGESFGHDVPDLSDPDKALWFRWCIQGRWKLILSYDGEAGRYGEVKNVHQAAPQLFDIIADPDETTNLADQHPSEVAQLRSSLDNIRKTRQP